MYDIDRMKEEIRIKDVCDMLGITLSKRSGANIFGSIRNERTGSFSINPEKNIWRDWGTGEGGSIIDLVMKVENVDKGKAIQRLAEHFNFQNETSSNKNYNSQLPTKKQFAEIGIISDRAISNFDLDLQKQSLEKLEELEKKYSISISELSKKNPQLYTKVLEKKALPLILSERNLLIDTISKYQKENTPLNREFIKSQIKELEESLNSKIDIYNKARIDDLNRDNLKINIYNKLPDESITVDFKEVYTFKYDVLHTVKDLLPYELSIGIGDDYYSTNLMIDKENGEALGLEITEQYTMEDYYKIIGTDKEAFIDKFYIEPLWEEFSQVVVNDKFEENGDSTLAEDFHIWKAETKIDDIKDWFEAHYNKELYQLEERTPLNFLDKSELDDTHVTISFDSKGTEYPQEIPNEEIEDMEAVREWLDTLDNNDSLLLKDDISHYLIHKSPKHEDGYQVSVFQDEALTKLNMDMQYPSKYALAKSLAVANDFEIIDSYTLSPIDNLTDRQESLDDELQKLEDNIRNLDFKINTYSNDLSENKGKYHLYSKDDTLIGTTNTKKEAKKVAQDIYLKTSGSVDVKNLKEEIPKLKEEVANARALYDTKLAEYKGILEYTNPYNPKIINEPPISSNILTQNNNNTSNNLKDEFISRLKDYGFKEEELEEFFDNTFDVRKINNEIEKAMFQAGTTEKIVENMVSTCVYADYSSDIDGTTTYSESVLWYKELVKDDVIKLAENEKLSYSELIDKLNPNNNVNEPHRYYLTQRPPSIGTHPNGALKTVSFDNKQNFEGVNCWGYVEYENPLTEAQINDYELTEKRALYDTKLAEYKGILEYTNPYNPKIINEPPISSNILTQNNNNTSNNLKDEFISRLKDYGFKEEELEEFFDNTFDVRKINNEIEKAMFQAGTTEKIVENMVSTCVYADYSSDIDGTTTYSESVLWYKELVKDDVIKLAENEKLSYSELIDKLNPNNNVNEPHRYYLTQRPPSIGTHPNGALKTVSFDNKQNFEGVNCWGYVEYENPLTEAQINDYELTEKKSYIYEINGENINLANENLKDIEYFKTTKNLSLDDGSRIRKGTSFIVEDGNDNGYEVRFEINDKNRYSNDTAEYVFTKDDILSLSEPEIELVNQKYSETDKNEILSKEINEIEENILTQNYIDKEIGDFMEEIKQAPLIDMKVDKDVDVSEILDNLKNGVGNIFNNESFIQYLNFQSQFHNYSPSNNMLIAIQNPQATNVASFTKWKSMGRTVNKGEKGIMILAPNVVKNGSKEIFARLDKYGKTNVNRYTFTKTNNSYNISITSNGKIVKNGLSKNELDNFIKVNKLNQTSIRGFRKTYVFDISQTSGQPVPQFKLNKLNDNDLLDNNGFYKNPLINVNISEGGIFEENQTLTFKQANEIYERKEKEIRALKQEYEAKGEYYPYLKQKFDVILKPNAPLDGVSRDIRADIGDGEYNNLLEALKGEMKGYPQVFDTLEKTLASNENTMETILAIKNQLENTVNSKNIDLEYTTATGKANGYFAPMENKICVNSEMSLSQTTKTLLHEYVHSQLHKDGIEAKDNLVGRQTAEIEAEATTYVVSKHFGFDTSEYSFDYVSTWARGKDVAELGQTLKTIKEASEKIINEIKAPLELELYNNRENIEEILKSQNVKPNDKIINNMIDINKETGKINTISDLSNAEKFKSYDNQELNNKISDTNKEIATNTVKVEVKTVTVGIER